MIGFIAPFVQLYCSHWGNFSLYVSISIALVFVHIFTTDLGCLHMPVFRICLIIECDLLVVRGVSPGCRLNVT